MLSCAAAPCDHVPRVKRRLDVIRRAKRAHARGVPPRRHPPKFPSGMTVEARPLAASRIVGPFYSLWISVKSLSSHTALFSAPLFSTLGGHFSSSSVEEGSQLGGTESVCFFVDMQYLSLAMVNILKASVPLRPGMPGVNISTHDPSPNITPAYLSSACHSFSSFYSVIG